MSVKVYTGKIKFKPIRNWAQAMGVVVEKTQDGYDAWARGDSSVVANSTNLEELIEDVYDIAGQI